MKRRDFLKATVAATAAAPLANAARAETPHSCRATGDLGVVIERASGSVLVVDTTARTSLGRITGLGDLSHASVVFSRDERFAFVFGRDGGLTKIDILERRIVGRVVQAGNAIGGAVSDDGRLIAVSNYTPGGVKVFDADTLAQTCDVAADMGNGKRSKTVGLVDVPGRRFVYTLYDAGAICLIDLSGPDPSTPEVTRFDNVGRLPYDAGITTDGRHYVAGLFGEDGLVHLDLWANELRPNRILDKYGRGKKKLPVYKMPHLEGWAQIGDRFLLPAVGHHELLGVSAGDFSEVGRVSTYGQPIFAVARPGSRHAWVNFAHPRNDTVQVVDALSMSVVHEMKPGPAVLHMEFTPRGHEVWVSVRDANRIDIYNATTFEKITKLAAEKPSGIFFTARAHRIGQ